MYLVFFICVHAGIECSVPLVGCSVKLVVGCRVSSSTKSLHHQPTHHSPTTKVSTGRACPPHPLSIAQNPLSSNHHQINSQVILLSQMNISERSFDIVTSHINEIGHFPFSMGRRTNCLSGKFGLTKSGSNSGCCWSPAQQYQRSPANPISSNMCIRKLSFQFLRSFKWQEGRNMNDKKRTYPLWPTKLPIQFLLVKTLEEENFSKTSKQSLFFWTCITFYIFVGT